SLFQDGSQDADTLVDAGLLRRCVADSEAARLLAIGHECTPIGNQDPALTRSLDDLAHALGGMELDPQRDPSIGPRRLDLGRKVGVDRMEQRLAASLIDGPNASQMSVEFAAVHELMEHHLAKSVRAQIEAPLQSRE